MKRKLSVLMVIVLVLSMLVGCTPNELELYSLIKQVSNLEFYETQGELAINLSGSLVEDMVKQEPEVESSIAFIDGLVLKYNSQQALQKNKALINFEFKNKENPNFSPLTSIILDENILYIEITHIKDLLIDLAHVKDVEISKDLEEALKDIDYISIDQTKLDSNPYGAVNQEEILEIYSFIFDSITEVFKNFDSKTVKKVGNKLTYELSTENILDVVENFLTYITENDEEIIKSINKVIDSMPTDILPVSKEELKSEIPYIEEEVRNNIDDVLLTLKENRKEIENTILNIIEGSKITYSIEKENNVFKTESNINLNLNYGYQTLNLKINEHASTKEIKEKYFIKTIDKERTIEFEDLMKIIEKPQLYYTAIVYIDSQEYITFDGDMYIDKINVVVKDNSTYLPLRRISEDLGEEVGWNPETKTPYIKRCNEIIEMKGLLVDNTAYVKLRDFEKLDYYVDWMEDTRGAYISGLYTLEEFLDMTDK